MTVPDILCCPAMHGAAATDSSLLLANHPVFRLRSWGPGSQVLILTEAPYLTRLLRRFLVFTLRSEVCHGSGASLEGKCNDTHPYHNARLVIVGHGSRLLDKLTGSISELSSLFQDTLPRRSPSALRRISAAGSFPWLAPIIQRPFITE